MNNSYDLVLVGTSFAASFFLKKYLEKSAPNVKVLVLERGQYFTHKERLENARKKSFGENSFVSSLGNQGRTFLTNNTGKPWIFDPNFGGSSNCWTGCTPRFMPNDFRLKSIYNIGQDWPITYEELEPYYCEAEAIMAISGPDETPYPMSKAYPLPPHRLSSVDKLIQEKYGNQYISQPTARASRLVGQRNACCNSSICHLCPVNAKFTIANTLKELYDDPRVEVTFQAQVLGLNCVNTYAKGVEYIKNNKRETVHAEIIALGANAIFNAHILLNSGDKNYYTGKGICEQVGYYAYVYLEGLKNIGGSTTITANGFMLYDGDHRKEQAACLIESHNSPFIRGEFGKWREIAKLKFIFEDLPQDKNQVLLSEDESKPLIHYSGHSNYVNKGYQNLKSKIEALFNFLPIESFSLDENHQLSESHILSTTKMGNDPHDSVIDKNMLHHQYRNVFVLGGGAFPSIGAANPTLTLSALSLMSANNSF